MSDFITRFIVDGALGLLAVFSTLTWVLILNKAYVYWRLAAHNRRFTKSFWSGAQRDPLHALGARLQSETGLKARLAQAAIEALSAPSAMDATWPGGLAATGRRELLERRLTQQIQRECRGLEQGLTLLASIANVAPFVGLFGTVFGIIHALNAMASGSASGIAGVAGPVGRALVATGVGIAVAIPAVLAYNQFLRRLRLTIAELEDYAVDLINLGQHHGFRLAAPEHGVAGPSASSRTDEVAA